VVTEYDAVVVGAGPNGLVGAVTLAGAGLRVLVLEATDAPGGGTRSAELTLPGHVHDVCSAIHPLALASPALRALPLADHGLEWVHPDVPLAHPLGGGRAAILDRSVEVTASSLGPDARAYERLMGPLVESGAPIVDTMLSPLTVPSPLAIPALVRFGLSAVWPVDPWARHRFETDEARGLMAGLAAHSMLSLGAPGTTGFGLFLGLLAHLVGWPMARGGSQAIADALVALLIERRGELVLGEPVTSLADLPPAPITMLDLSPRQVLQLGGDRLPARYRRRLAGFDYGSAVWKVDWALDGPIPWSAAGVRRGRDAAPRWDVGGGGFVGARAEARSDRRASLRAAGPAVALRPHPGAGGSRDGVGLLPRSQRLGRRHDRSDRGPGRAVRPRLP
jgi:phytoene dehydrogenase-like protein